MNLIFVLLVTQTAGEINRANINVDTTIPLWGIFLLSITYLITFIIFVIKLWSKQMENTTAITTLQASIIKLTDDIHKSLGDNIKSIEEKHSKEIAHIKETNEKDFENTKHRIDQIEKGFHSKIDREILSVKEIYNSSQQDVKLLSEKIDNIKSSIDVIGTEVKMLTKRS